MRDEGERPDSLTFHGDPRKMQEISAATEVVAIHAEPLQLEDASAKVAGEGSLVVVNYRFNKVPARDKARTVPYVLDEATGRPLFVQTVPIIGPLFSHTLTRMPVREGYFVVDNGYRILKSGSKITVVIGDAVKKNIPVGE